MIHPGINIQFELIMINQLHISTFKILHTTCLFIERITMQRIINIPDMVVEDMLKGFVKAHRDILTPTDDERVLKI